LIVRTTYALASLAQLHGTLDRVYKLALSLPDAPLVRFQLQTAGLGGVEDVAQFVAREAVGARVQGIELCAQMRTAILVPTEGQAVIPEVARERCQRVTCVR
jgi:hypothetical protein